VVPSHVYSAEKIDAQLDQSMASFLRQETDIAHNIHKIYVSKIFYWYNGDFGGKEGHP
jgi:hypothetical protein